MENIHVLATSIWKEGKKKKQEIIVILQLTEVLINMPLRLQI